MENRIEVYHRLYVLCMAGMLPGLLLSIFLYIRLDMYEVFGYFRRKWCVGRKCTGKSKRKVSFLLLFVTAFVLWTGLGLLAHGEEEQTEDVSGVRIVCQEADIQIGERVYYRDSFWMRIKIEKEQTSEDSSDETLEKILNSCEWKLYKDGEEVEASDMEWSEEEDHIQGELWIKADQETHRTDGIYELVVVRTEKEEMETPDITDSEEPEEPGTEEPEIDSDLSENENDEEDENPEVSEKVIELHSPELVLDTSAPEIEIHFTTQSGEPVSYGNYQEYGYWFSKEPVTARIQVTEPLSGIGQAEVVIIDADGEVVQKKLFDCEMEGMSGERDEISLDGEEEIQNEADAPRSQTPCWEQSIVLPDNGTEFDGTIIVNVEDRLNNTDSQTGCVIVESEQVHQTQTPIRMEILTEPGRVVDGEAYYRSDVQVKYAFEDEISGLQKLSLKAGNELTEEKNYLKQAGTDRTGSPNLPITYTYEWEGTIAAEHNNQNDVSVSATVVDNTGYEDQIEEKLHIDTTVPEITVEYDKNDPANERFYQESRTATVSIKERNFDANDVEFLITGTDGVRPTIGEWGDTGDGDETVHRCQVVFSEDGEYTFSVKFQDKAGNQAAYDRIDEFVIDQTAPVLTVQWDTEQSQNGSYYAKGRQALIRVEERNFAPEEMEVLVEQEYGQTQSSDWEIHGQIHQKRVYFSEDGTYGLTVKGRDLAGNTCSEYRADLFVIDQTPPDLEIRGVAEGSANAGVLKPEIISQDLNYQPGSLEVRLTGSLRGERTFSGEFAMMSGGEQYTYENFPNESSTDDIYVLEAVARDLAGNESRQTCSFSVNRFGSVYTFDQLTEQLLDGNRYLKHGAQMTITETNVDGLHLQNILYSHNGKSRTLKKDQDYTISEKETLGDWKQYIYQIRKEVFSQNGVYEIAVCSEDLASNYSNTILKDRTIRFVVDHTPPRIHISGIRNQGIYREQERVVNLYLEDNLCLDQAEVTFGGDTTSYDAETLRTSDNGIVLHLGKEEQWQNLRVRAIDAAGNETEESLNFLIWPENGASRNWLWLLGILVALVIIVACKMSRKSLYCMYRKAVDKDGRDDR